MESNRNKYLKLFSTDESKDTTKCYTKKIYVKIKFIFNDESPLNKTLKLYRMIIFVRSVFHKSSKVSFGKKVFKYVVGYKTDGKFRSLLIILPRM